MQTLAQSPIESAHAHLVAGRLNESEATCLDVLRQAAEHPQALFLLGLVRFRSGRAEEAVRLLERAVRAAPDFTAAHNELGIILITLGRRLEAIATLHRAAELEPGNAEVQVNLGNAYHSQGELDTAEGIYREALRLDPNHVRGHVSLGNLLYQVHRTPEALEIFARAAALAPGNSGAHHFLGKALRDVGRVDEALASFQRAIALDAANAEAHEDLGLTLKNLGRFEEAIPVLRAAGRDYAHAMALECLLRLGRYDDFFGHVRDHREAEAVNLHSASLTAYASYHLGRPDPHPFCPSPLEQVRVVNCYTGAGADAQFLQELIAEARQLNAMWEPRGITTRRGYQTGGNIFDHGFPAIARLQRDMMEQMQRYRASLMPSNMTMVTRWPANGRLHGWFVRLLTGGHQYYHNHPYGWATGCLYLQLPKSAPPGEGAIEFGLESGGYPKLSDKEPPTVRHFPAAGQVAFFPSSLYHRTIPFSSDEERMCIAFDLLPG